MHAVKFVNIFLFHVKRSWRVSPVSMRSENFCHRTCPMLYRWEFQKMPLRKKREGFEESLGLILYSFVSPAIMLSSFGKKVLVRGCLRQRQQRAVAAALQSCATVGLLPGSMFPVLSAVHVAIIHS